MPTCIRLSVLIALSVALRGQAPKSAPTKAKQNHPSPTRIGNHQIDETFSEWLKAEKIDLDAVCASGERANNHEWATSSATNYADLFTARSDASLCDGLKPFTYLDHGSFHYSSGIQFGSPKSTLWTFSSGRLVEEQNVYAVEIFPKEFGFLKEAYGAPAQTTKIQQQNAFGAKWDDILMTWHLPDGATLYMKALGGPKDDLIITFRSKDYPDDSTTKGPNPYLPKPTH